MTSRRIWVFVAAFIALASCTSDGQNVGQQSSPAPQVTVTETVTLTPTPAATPTQLPVGCRSTDPQAGVAAPGRYNVLDSCKVARGVVVSSSGQADGTHRLGIQLNRELGWLIDDGNRSAQGGMMIAHLVPADMRGCTSGCTGANLTAPVVGDYIEFSGPLVRNTQGWREIHPVWRWVMLKSSPARAIPTTQPPTRRASPRLVTPDVLDVRIESITPNPVRPGQTATLRATTRAGTECELSIVYASGHTSTARGLGQATADSSGRIGWAWMVGTRTGAGTSTATVACGSVVDRMQFEVS